MKHQDRLKRYEDEFAWAIEQAFPLSEFTYNGFKELQHALELTDADVLPIEQRLVAHAESRQQAYQDKLKHYKQLFMQAIDEHSLPLPEAERLKLQKIQQSFGLRDEDVKQLERPILARKEIEQEQAAPPPPAETEQSQSQPTVATEKQVGEEKASSSDESSHASSSEPDQTHPVMHIAPEEVPSEAPRILSPAERESSLQDGADALPDQQAETPLDMNEIIRQHQAIKDTGLDDVAKPTSVSDTNGSLDNVADRAGNQQGDSNDPDIDPDSMVDDLSDGIYDNGNPIWDDTDITPTDESEGMFDDEPTEINQTWDDTAKMPDRHHTDHSNNGSTIHSNNGKTDRSPAYPHPKADHNGHAPSSNVPATELYSDLQERYANLESLLQEGLWRSADQETLNIMLKVTNCTKCLDREAIEQFPNDVLQHLDKLWLQYSISNGNSKFGFSIQYQLYTELKQTELKQGSAIAFAKRVGWWMKGLEMFKFYSMLSFSLRAPRGHLPALWFWRIPWQDVVRYGNFGRGGSGGDRWLLTAMMSRIQDCNL